MKISKQLIIDLLKLFLETLQQSFQEVSEGISCSDEQFIQMEFQILADESNLKLRTNGISFQSLYLRKNSNAYLQLIALCELDSFQAIVKEWHAATKMFDASKALEQFCCGVAFEHRAIYGFSHPPESLFLDKFADGLLCAIEKGAYPIHCLVFLKDLWMDQSITLVEPFDLLKERVPSITIRRPNEGDYEMYQDWKKVLHCGGLHHLQQRIGMQTAVIDFFWYDREPIKFNNQSEYLSASIQFQCFQQSLGHLMLLLENSSIRMTEFRYTFGCSGGPISIFDSSPGRCVSIKELERKLKWVGKLALPLLMNSARENKTILRALNYYQDSMFRSLGVESRISLAISGLEALYLSSEGVKSEIILRLSLRVTRLLSYLGFDIVEVKANISKAYAIRSGYVHGSAGKEKDFKEAEDLSEKIHNYLRLSILSFVSCLDSSVSQNKLMDELFNASFSLPISNTILQALVGVKAALISNDSQDI